MHREFAKLMRLQTTNSPEVNFSALVACLFFFVLGFTDPARGAEIRLVETENCTFSLTGMIEGGDADKFEEVLSSYRRGIRTLCLDSPGGVFAEAISISKLLYELGVATYVGNGSRCISACSIVFMFGTSIDGEEGPRTNRRMHIDARIGFHRPAIDVSDNRVFDKEEIVRSFNLALQSVFEFMQIANERSWSNYQLSDFPANVFPAGLFEKMIAVSGPESYFYIDTVGKAVRWGIRLDGLRLPRHLGSEALYNACNNRQSAEHGNRRDFQSVNEKFDFLNAPPVIIFRPADADDQRQNFAIASSFGIEETFYACLLRIERYEYAIDNLGLSYCQTSLDADYDLNNIYECSPETRIDPRMVFPRGTLLKDSNSVAILLETSGPQIGSAQINQLDSPPTQENQLWSQCDPRGQDLTVVNVTSFVNMRDGTDSNNRIVAEVPLGTTLEFAREIRVGGSASTQQCRALCGGARKQTLSTTQEEALIACFEDNAVWYNVRMSNGVDGWVSGKFLDLVN